MLRKVLTVAVLWWVVIVYNSCCSDLPYFLYDSVIVDVLRSSTVPASDSLSLYIRPQVTEYVSQHGAPVSKSFAWQCTQGDSGPKYPIVNFRIITEQDFVTGYPAGSDVTDLFFIRYYAEQSVRYEDVRLTDLPDPDQFLLSIIWTKRRLAPGRSITFRIEVINTIGQRITGTSPSITWE